MDNASNHPAVPNPLTEQLRQLAAADAGLTEALSRAESTEAALQCIADASARTGIPLDLDAARALLAQAEAQRQAGVESLSDEALDEMAGGTVRPGILVWSVLTAGLYCAFTSLIVRSGGQYTCEDLFHGRIPRTHPPGD